MFFEFHMDSGLQIIGNSIILEDTDINTNTKINLLKNPKTKHNSSLNFPTSDLNLLFARVDSYKPF